MTANADILTIIAPLCPDPWKSIQKPWSYLEEFEVRNGKKMSWLVTRLQIRPLCINLAAPGKRAMLNRLMEKCGTNWWIEKFSPLWKRLKYWLRCGEGITIRLIPVVHWVIIPSACDYISSIYSISAGWTTIKVGTPYGVRVIWKTLKLVQHKKDSDKIRQ